MLTLKVKLILVSLPLLFLLCNEPNSNSANNMYYIEGAEAIGTNFVGNISQSCPIGVTCDQSFDYHAYDGKVDSLQIYFSFKPQWLNNKTLQGAIENFNYLYLSLYLPSRGTDSIAYFYNLDAVWGASVNSSTIYCSITGYSNDTLSGVIKVKFPYLIKRIKSNDPNCRTGDIGGVCFEQLNEPGEYIISYRIKLAE
jgi:hypothetical protein